MANASTPTVGVVNAPAVAQSLRELGFRVLTADGFRDAATLVSNALKEGGTFPVVVAESDATGLSPWVTSIAAKTAVVVLGTRPDLALHTAGATRLELPSTVNGLLPLIGYQAALHEIGERTLEVETPAAPPTVTEVPAAPALAPLPTMAPRATSGPQESVAPSAPSPSASDAELYPPSNLAREQPVQVEVQAAVPASAPTSPAVSPAGLFDAPPVTISAAPPLAPAQAPPAGLFDTTQAPAVSLTPVAPAVSPTPIAPAVTPTPYPEQQQQQPAPTAYAPTPMPEVDAPAPAQQWPLSPIQTDPEPAYTQPREPQTAEDLFESVLRPQHETPTAAATGWRTAAGPQGQVIVVGGGKGGIGKTTQSLLAAHRAAQAGMRVTLIDANRGQADIRTNLRLTKAPLPSIVDAARTGNPADALILPDQYNQHRPPMLERLDFALVQGPPPEWSDPAIATPEVYGRVLDYARERSDLVVVDTQIAEAHHGDLFDRFVIPTLISGGWWVAIVNDSRAGVDNLRDRLKEFRARGVTNARTLILASLYEDFDEATRQAIEREYGAYGTFIGSAGVDPAVRSQLNLGNLLTASPAVAPATDAILHRVTGRPEFAPAPPGRKRRFGRKRRA